MFRSPLRYGAFAPPRDPDPEPQDDMDDIPFMVLLQQPPERMEGQCCWKLMVFRPSAAVNRDGLLEYMYVSSSCRRPPNTPPSHPGT